jgi:hypothetical protein
MYSLCAFKKNHFHKNPRKMGDSARKITKIPLETPNFATPKQKIAKMGCPDMKTGPKKRWVFRFHNLTADR